MRTISTVILLTHIVGLGWASEPSSRYGWSNEFAVSGGGFGGLQATPAANQSMLVVPGPRYFVSSESDTTGTAPYAQWTGTQWVVPAHTEEGCGSFSPLDVAVMADELYVGGNFTNLCGTGIDRLARFDRDSGTWEPVTGNLNAQVSALAWDGNDRLYVGGSFDRAGNTDVDYIFYLQQGNIMPLPEQGGLTSGTNAPVRDIGIGAGGVVIAGDFTTAGGQTGGTCCVAHWNPGTESWAMFPEISSGLAVGTIDEVLAVGTQIYIAGGWNFPNLPAADQPSRAAVGGEFGWTFLADDPRGTVNEIASTGGGVFVAADGFDQNLGDGSPGSGPKVAEWAGGWLDLGDNDLALPADIDILGSDGVFITGNNQTRLSATVSDVVIAAGAAHFDPGTRRYQALGQGVGFADNNSLGGQVRTLVLFQNHLYAGGEINFAGISTLCCGLLRRNPDSSDDWMPAGLFEGDVHTMIEFEGELWVGGMLVQAGGEAARAVARWNGTIWSVADEGIPAGDYLVRDLAVHDGQLYAAGSTSFGGALLDGTYLLRWNGANWDRAAAAGTAGLIVDLEPYAGDLHVAGNVPTPAGPTTIDFVARFDGSAFHKLGGGISGSGNDVFALLATGGDLLVGGRFRSVDAGLVDAQHIARWDGSQWAAMGVGLGSDGFSSVRDLQLFEGQVIAAGDFANLGDGLDRSVSRLAAWDGSAWTSVAGGINDFLGGGGLAQALLAQGSSLWVGGRFDQAGGRGNPLSLSFNIARLSLKDVIFDQGGFE